jgi:hypothetical protein
MRILTTMPHFFKGIGGGIDRSTRAGAQRERLRALTAAVYLLRHALAAAPTTSIMAVLPFGPRYDPLRTRSISSS